jgi:hypothetical protein
MATPCPTPLSRALAEFCIVPEDVEVNYFALSFCFGFFFTTVPQGSARWQEPVVIEGIQPSLRTIHKLTANKIRQSFHT